MVMHVCCYSIEQKPLAEELKSDLTAADAFAISEKGPVTHQRSHDTPWTLLGYRCRQDFQADFWHARACMWHCHAL